MRGGAGHGRTATGRDAGRLFPLDRMPFSTGSTGSLVVGQARPMASGSRASFGRPTTRVPRDPGGAAASDIVMDLVIHRVDQLLGGSGTRSVLAFASSMPNGTRRRPGPCPSRALASANRCRARSSKDVLPAETLKRAARLLRASPRSACRTILRTCSRRCSFAAFIGLPLAQEWTLRRDTSKSRPICSEVNPEVRRSSAIALLVSSAGSTVVKPEGRKTQPGERCSTDRRGSPPNHVVIIVTGHHGCQQRPCRRGWRLTRFPCLPCRRQAELRPLPVLGWQSRSNGSCYPAYSGQGTIHPMPRQPGKQT